MTGYQNSRDRRLRDRADRGLSLRARLLSSFVLVSLLPGLFIGILLWVLGQDRTMGLLNSVGGIGLSLAVVLVTLGIALGVASLVNRGLLQRLHRLATAAAEIAEGDWERRLPIEREDEIGDLAASLNRIVAQVGHTKETGATESFDPCQRAELLEAARQATALGVLLARLITPLHVSGRRGEDPESAPSHSHIDRILDVAAGALVTQLGFSHAALYLVDDGRRALVLKATSAGRGSLPARTEARLPLDDGGVIVEAFECGEPRLDPADPRDAGSSAVPGDPRIILPLSVAEQIVGVLLLDMAGDPAGSENAHSLAADDWVRCAATEAGMATLQSFANQIGLALTYAQALDEAQVKLHALSRIVWQERQAIGQGGLPDRSQGSRTYVYDGVDVDVQIRSTDVAETSVVQSAADQDGVAVEGSDFELPLGPSDEPLGYVKMVARPGQSLDAQDLALARAISEEAGEAFVRARLREDDRAMLDDVETLYRCSQAMIRARSPQEILVAIVEQGGFAARAQGILDRAWLLVQDSRGATTSPRLRRAATFGVAQPVDRVWSYDHLPILESGDLVVVEDMAGEGAVDDISRKTLSQDFGLASAFLAPLRGLRGLSDQAASGGERQENHGELVGWLVMGSSAHSYRFSERERRIIGGYGGTSHHGDIKHGLADIAATMLRHLQYLEQAAQRARQAQLVGSISTRVRETLDMDLILQTALREIGENMGISSIEVQMQRRAAVAPSTVGDAPSTVGGAPSASTSMPKEAVQQPDPGRAEGPDETEQVR